MDCDVHGVIGLWCEGLEVFIPVLHVSLWGFCDGTRSLIEYELMFQRLLSCRALSVVLQGLCPRVFVLFEEFSCNVEPLQTSPLQDGVMNPGSTLPHTRNPKARGFPRGVMGRFHSGSQYC